MEYLFTFDDTFEIHDDIEVLKRMGMALGLNEATCNEENLAKVDSNYEAFTRSVCCLHFFSLGKIVCPKGFGTLC